MTTSAAGVTARHLHDVRRYWFVLSVLILQQEMERKEKEKQRNGATNLAINGDHLSK